MVTTPPKDVRRRPRIDYRTHDGSLENSNNNKRNLQHRPQNKQTQTLGTSEAEEEKPGARKKQSDSHPSGGAYKAKADEAFLRLKELLEALPTVTKPIKGETLIMYLAALEESISTVLMAERGKKQISVYFVLSDKPIKQILVRPEKSGHIAKCAIELGEHEIKFRGRNSIKRQILADFLAKTPSKEDEGAKDEEAKRKESKQKKHEKCSLMGPQDPMAPKQVIQDKSITQKEVANVTHEKEDSWMIPIREYLQFGKLLDNPQKVRKLRIKAPLYRIMDGTLYRIPKIILFAMVKMCRKNTGQKHHPRSTSRFMRNARRSTVSCVKDLKAGILLAINA
nr:reverse transcriptase domain-containing protein [Tanacetum cinerariifolium]